MKKIEIYCIGVFAVIIGVHANPKSYKRASEDIDNNEIFLSFKNSFNIVIYVIPRFDICMNYFSLQVLNFNTALKEIVEKSKISNI